MRHLDLRTLLRLAQGIEGDPEIRDYSVLVAAIARHEATLMGRILLPRPVDAAAALLHTIVLLKPLSTFGNDVLGWVAAYTLLGINGLKVQADPHDALALVQAAAAGELDEREIAERLFGYITG